MSFFESPFTSLLLNTPTGLPIVYVSSKLELLRSLSSRITALRSAVQIATSACSSCLGRGLPPESLFPLQPPLQGACSSSQYLIDAPISGEAPKEFSVSVKYAADRRRSLDLIKNVRLEQRYVSFGESFYFFVVEYSHWASHTISP